MAKKRSYEQQAKLSVVLAVVGGVCLLAGAFCVFQAFDPQNFWVVYNPRGKRILAIGGALFLAMAAGGVGFLVGLNSAGQRQNTRNGLSWTGFFLNAAVIALTLSCGVFFYLTKYAIEIKPK